jgi:predicted acyl esterase
VYRPSDDLDFTLSVFREGDRFYIQGMGQPKIEIFPEAENQFFMKVLDVEIRFVRDVQGSVTGLVSKQNGEESDAPKISSVAKDEFVAFDRREQMIPMRDGIRLHTLIFTPKDQNAFP